METLAIYLLKSALCAAIFLGIYWCFFKNETFYRFNRYFLMTGLICSVVLPFYTYSYDMKVVTSGKLLPEGEMMLSGTATTGNFWIYGVLFAYLSGSVFLLLRHVFGLGKIKSIVKKYGYTSLKGCRVVTTDSFKSSFSVFNYIILDNSTETSATERKLILEHELAHVQQMHWVDLLMAQVFCAFQWFNPFAWIYLYLIKQNHEFLADQAVLEQGNSAAVYRAALINHCLGTPVFSFSSSFAQSDKMKRINMMMKPASTAVKKIAVFVLLPALACFVWAFAEPNIVIVVPETEVQNKTNTILPHVSAADNKQTKENATAAIFKKSPKIPLASKVFSKPAVALRDTVKMEEKSNLSKQVLRVRNQPLYVVDGIETSSIEAIDANDIESINVYKDEAAIKMYGDKGRNGVILVTMKKSAVLKAVSR